MFENELKLLLQDLDQAQLDAFLFYLMRVTGQAVHLYKR